MADETDIDTVVSNPGTATRKVCVKRAKLSEFQKQLLEYRACYRGKLFAESKRRNKWGKKWDKYGNAINPDTWKPLVIPPIAKVMVHTQTAYLCGDDKFPTVNVTSIETGLYPSETLDPELDPEIAERKQLQAFASDLLEQARLEEHFQDLVSEGLILGENPILLRFFEGVPFYTIVDRTWCDWGFDENDPYKIVWFEERYFFKRTDDPKDYVFRRFIDAGKWVEFEGEVISRKKGKDEITWGKPVVDWSHNMGFCPVSVLTMPRGQSMYADEMVCNIKGYIESKNNIKSGVEGNMDPQWALLKRDDGNPRIKMPGGDDEAPLEKNALWELTGDSLQAFTNNTEGFKTAADNIEEEKASYYQSARVVDIPEDNEQSGRALMFRFAPQFAEVKRLRTALGYCLCDLVTKTIMGAMIFRKKLKLPSEKIPSALTQFKVSLDWGQLLPNTPEQTGLELANADLAVEKGFLSQRTANRYIQPLFGVEDLEEEDQQIKKEQDEKQKLMLDMQAAAFAQAKGDENGDPPTQEGF
jgi:hypothetical protein